MRMRSLVLLMLVFILGGCAGKSFKPEALDYSTLKIESKKKPLKYAVYTPPNWQKGEKLPLVLFCLLYTSPSPRDKRQSRMPSSA